MWYPSHWSTARANQSGWAKEDAPKVGRNMVALIELLREKPIEWS
jgi:hypothetical protein